jgi:hypothetical protein
MNILQTAELAVLNFVIGYLKTNASQLEAELGPIETQLINNGIKIADAWFAKLPLGLGGLLNGLLEGYAGQLPGDINQYVGVGITYVVNYLTALAAHISAPAA